VPEFSAYDPTVPRPWKITLVANELCNLRCRHCYAWRTGDRRGLATGSILSALDELNDWVGAYKLFLAGGEPTLRDDLAVIVERAAGRGNLVSLATNGSRIDRSAADTLVRAGLGHVDVALDSLTPAIHDRNRGRSGAHERAVRAIRLLDEARRRHGARMYINAAAVVAGFNVHELPALAAWVADSGADNLLLQPVMPPFWSTHDHDWLVASELWPRDRDAVGEAIDALVAIKRAGGPIDNDLEQLEGMRGYFDEAQTGEPLIDPFFAADPERPEQLADAERGMPGVEPLETADEDWGAEYLRDAPDPGEIGARRWLATLDPSSAREGELPPRIDRCEIGRKSININHLGDVRICHEMPPVGNLTHQTLYEAWTSARADRVRELISRCHQGCYLLNCNYCD
jgi:MoaA/NifB/PqqE/SkfB family radical SAM enzyme